MKGVSNANLKPHLFKRSAFTPIQYQDNFPVEWKVTGIHYHFKNLNNFPTNTLNRNLDNVPYNAHNEYLTIMQSKNCQEITFKHGNYLVQAMLKYAEEQSKEKEEVKDQTPHAVLM